MPVIPGKRPDPLAANVSAISRIEAASSISRGRCERISDAIAGFSGSITFVWIHLVWFGAWLFVNATPSLPKRWHFDPPPFGVLTLVVSLEAIFLSTFIMISQNRQQMTADRRNKLDLQINLLAEQENSEMLRMLRALMKHHGLQPNPETEALAEFTDPERVAEVLDNIETAGAN